MRSRCETIGLIALVALAACGTDVDPTCTKSTLTYETFGAPFMSDWCLGCHSAGVDAAMRQLAPIDVNFDTIAEVRTQSRSILETTSTMQTMPPAGGPSDSDRELLAEWLSCGAP